MRANIIISTFLRLIVDGVQLQSIQLEWTAQYAATADPYLCVLSACGRALVLALREFRGKDGSVRIFLCILWYVTTAALVINPCVVGHL